MCVISVASRRCFITSTASRQVFFVSPTMGSALVSVQINDLNSQRLKIDETVKLVFVHVRQGVVGDVPEQADAQKPTQKHSGDL